MNTQAHVCVHTRRHRHTCACTHADTSTHSLRTGSVWALGTEGVSEGVWLPSQD